MLTFGRLVKQTCCLNALIMVSSVAFALPVAQGTSQSCTLPGRTLNDRENAIVTTALATLRAKCPGTLASLLVQLHDNGQIRSALPDDRYLRDAETHGGTPFAYTLPRSDAPRHPVAIVLAKRFMDATPTAQAALLAHEAGHWQAFQERGTSNEYDGYKAEYDAATPLGFSEKDGLAYFAMLDGVVEYVVPRSPAYAKQHDVKDFMESTQDKSLSPK